jgi:hypothetical protein
MLFANTFNAAAPRRVNMRRVSFFIFLFQHRRRRVRIRKEHRTLKHPVAARHPSSRGESLALRPSSSTWPLRELIPLSQRGGGGADGVFQR